MKLRLLPVLAVLAAAAWARPSQAAPLRAAATDNRITVSIGGWDDAPRDYAGEVISRWKLPPSSLAADIVRLAADGRLVAQSDPALARKGLLVPDGGLCNSACTATVAMGHAAAYPLAAREFESHAEAIADVVESISRVEGRDARLGSGVHEAARYLERLMALEALPDSLDMSLSHGTGVESHIQFEPGAVRLASIDYEKTDGNAGGKHAVLLLAIDPQNKRLLVSDPNFPRLLAPMAYRQTQYPIGVYLLNGHERLARFEGGVLIRRGALRRLPQDVRDRLSR